MGATRLPSVKNRVKWHRQRPHFSAPPGKAPQGKQTWCSAARGLGTWPHIPVRTRLQHQAWPVLPYLKLREDKKNKEMQLRKARNQPPRDPSCSVKLLPAAARKHCAVSSKKGAGTQALRVTAATAASEHAHSSFVELSPSPKPLLTVSSAGDKPQGKFQDVHVSEARRSTNFTFFPCLVPSALLPASFTPRPTPACDTFWQPPCLFESRSEVYGTLWVLQT